MNMAYHSHRFGGHAVSVFRLDSSAVKMEAAEFSEALVKIHHTRLDGVMSQKAVIFIATTVNLSYSLHGGKSV